MDKLKKKLSSRSGISLSELLLAVAIMGILFTAIVSGVNSAAHVYRRSVTVSECQTLSSTLSNAIENELRYATNIRSAGEEISFDSAVFGPGVTINTENGRVKVGDYELLSNGAYTTGLEASATVDDFTDGIFTVTVEVSSPLISPRTTTLKIRALNL